MKYSRPIVKWIKNEFGEPVPVMKNNGLPDTPKPKIKIVGQKQCVG